MPTRGWVNRGEPAIPATFQVTANPDAGPRAVSCVLPTARPVRIPVTGLNVATPESATLQRSGASGTGTFVAVSPSASTLAVPVSGTWTSVDSRGRTDSLSTTWCTDTSTFLFCSSPETTSVVLPGPTAVTTPARLTRATLWPIEPHCSVSGFTLLLFCVVTAMG